MYRNSIVIRKRRISSRTLKPTLEVKPAAVRWGYQGGVLPSVLNKSRPKVPDPRSLLLDSAPCFFANVLYYGNTRVRAGHVLANTRLLATYSMNAFVLAILKAFESAFSASSASPTSSASAAHAGQGCSLFSATMFDQCRTLQDVERTERLLLREGGSSFR